MSQAFIEPRLDPVIICESFMAKVSAVRDETLLVCEFIKVIGFDERLL